MLLEHGGKNPPHSWVLFWTSRCCHTTNATAVDEASANTATSHTFLSWDRMSKVYGTLSWRRTLPQLVDKGCCSCLQQQRTFTACNGISTPLLNSNVCFESGYTRGLRATLGKVGWWQKTTWLDAAAFSMFSLALRCALALSEKMRPDAYR